MKKVGSIILSLIASSVFAKECLVEVNKLKVREEPNIKSKVVAKLEAGSVAKITDETKGWYEVGIGWIKKEYCTVLNREGKKVVEQAKKLGELIPNNDNQNIGLYPQIVDTIFSYVTISLTDVSRITCPKEIKWFTYSKEKQIQIQKAGNNLLVKVSPKVISVNSQVKEVKRETFPRELITECNGQVFTLILIPKKVPTQTIVLKPLMKDKKKALRFETANPYEETLKQLIKSAYKELPIDGYEIKIVNRPYKKFKRLDMDLYKIYKGAYYQIREYSLKAKSNIDLHEKLFVPFLPESTLAIAISKLHLRAGEKARMFVVLKEEN